jgi:DNA-binding CsgD family transcriptional regulator
MEFDAGNSSVAHRVLVHDADAVAGSDDSATRSSVLVVLALRAAWADGHLGTGAAHGPGETFPLLLPRLRNEAEAVVKSWRRGEARRAPNTDREVNAWLLPPAPLAIVWGRHTKAYRAYHQVTERSRRTGSSSELAFTLSQMAMVDIVTGRWIDAHAHATEALAIAEVGGITNVVAQCSNNLGWLAALRGDVDAAHRLTSSALAVARERDVRALVAASQWHRGVAALFGERPEDAIALLAPITDPASTVHHPTFALLAAFDTAEAAARVGAVPELERQRRLVARWAVDSGAAWARSLGSVLAALLTDGSEAEQMFLDALEGLDAQERPLLLARTELLFGEWLRRARRRDAAHSHLSRAAEMFQAMGALPLLARTDRGLELTTQTRRTASRRDDPMLTVQELRVARLAATGSTNRTIAGQMFISPRTVGHHLEAVYQKLQMTSRRELATADL